MSTRNGHTETTTPLVGQLRELSAGVEALKEAGLDSLTDSLAHWLSAHYAAAARQAVEETSGAGLPLKTLRALTADVVALRRGDHSATRLLLEREWIEIERGKCRERMEKQFEEWLVQRNRENGGRLSEEECARRIREILHRPEPEKRGLSPETLAEIERALKLM